jgi:hypothetical protein
MKDFQVWGFGLNGGHETTHGEFDSFLEAVALAVECSNTCSSSTQNVFDAVDGLIVFNVNRVEPAEGCGPPVNYVCGHNEARASYECHMAHVLYRTAYMEQRIAEKVLEDAISRLCRKEQLAYKAAETYCNTKFFEWDKKIVDVQAAAQAERNWICGNWQNL